MNQIEYITNDENIVKSKYVQRDELRDKLYQNFGDSESLFSVDSDLLQIVTYALINLYESIESNEEYSSILNTVNPDALKSINLISSALKDRSLIFPVDTKRQYKSEEDITERMKSRYTETSIYLNQYYRDQIRVDDSEES